jgi:hypothetical protein
MPFMSRHNDTQLLAWALRNLEANFKASIIRHWPDFEAIAHKYGCVIEVTNGSRPQPEGGFLWKYGRNKKLVRRNIDMRNNNHLRGVAIDLGIVRSNRDNDIEDVEYDIVETICREIASAWKDEPIKWGGLSGDPIYFEWTAKVRRFERPLITNRQPIPQPPALGPIPTPWETILTSLKRLLHRKSMYQLLERPKGRRQTYINT